MRGIKWPVLLVCLALVGGCVRPYSFEKLEAGMTRDEVARVLKRPLVYVSGASGAELFVMEQEAKVPGAFPAREQVFLQFRDHRLAGWKGNWDMQKRLF